MRRRRDPRATARAVRPLAPALPLALAALLALAAGCEEDVVTVVGPGYDPFLSVDPRLIVELPVCGRGLLAAAWSEPSGEAWLAGSGGLVLHHRDGIWEREATGTDAGLGDLVRAGDGTLLAVGAGGTVLRREGGRWVRESVPATAPLLGACPAGDGSVYAVGAGGTLLHRTGGGWRVEEGPGPHDLRCVAAYGDSLLVGGGVGGVWLRTGGAWSVPAEAPDEAVLDVAYLPGAGWMLATANLHYRLLDGSEWSIVNWDDGGSLSVEGGALYGGSLFRLAPTGSGLDRDYYRMGFEVTIIHAASPKVVLAAGLDGEIAWYDADRDTFIQDAGSRLEDALLTRCADGSVLLRDRERFLREEGGRWREDIPQRHGYSFGTEAFAGLSDRDYHFLRVEQVEDGWDNIWALCHAAGGNVERLTESASQVWDLVLSTEGEPLLSLEQQVYRYADGALQVEESLPALDARWQLYRTLADEVYAVQSSANEPGALYRRGEADWAPVLALSADMQGWTRAVAGCYPEGLYIFTTARYVGLRKTASDSIRVERYYEDLDGVSGQAIAWAEGPDGIYIVTKYPGLVLRLSGVPGGEVLERVAGPLGDSIVSAAVAPDGSLVLVSGSTGRLYRLRLD